jgi:hypothetical protein
VVPSTRRTRRPRQRHQGGVSPATNELVSRAGVETIDSGSRARALQVGPGVGAPRLQDRHHPLDQDIVERLLAAAVRRQDLSEEHRQRLGRRERALAMPRQLRLDPIEQLRAGSRAMG